GVGGVIPSFRIGSRFGGTVGGSENEVATEGGAAITGRLIRNMSRPVLPTPPSSEPTFQIYTPLAMRSTGWTGLDCPAPGRTENCQYAKPAKANNTTRRASFLSRAFIVRTPFELLVKARESCAPAVLMTPEMRERLNCGLLDLLRLPW